MENKAKSFYSKDVLLQIESVTSFHSLNTEYSLPHLDSLIPTREFDY
jgi:hypothetical protein